MKIFWICALVFVFAVLVVADDQCTAGDVTSQNEISTTTGTGLTPDRYRGQVFHAICTGHLLSISVDLITVRTPGTILFELYEGNASSGWAGLTPVAHESKSANRPGALLFTLRTPYPVSKNQFYNFRLSTTDAEVGLAYARGNPYEEGGLLVQEKNDATSHSLVELSDLTFTIQLGPSRDQGTAAKPAQAGSALQLFGFMGQRYTLNLVDNTVYNLLTDDYLSVNFVVDRFPYDAVDRQYIVKLGINFNRAMLTLDAGGPGFYSTPSLNINNRDISLLDENPRDFTPGATYIWSSVYGDGHDIYGLPWLGDYAVRKLFVQIPGRYTIEILCIEDGRDPTTGAWHKHPRRWLDIEVIPSLTPLFSPHGLLGQTATNVMEPFEIQGTVSDYSVPNGILGTELKNPNFNRYTP